MLLACEAGDVLPASTGAAWPLSRPLALLSRGPSENGMELSGVPKFCGGQEESVGNPQNSYGSRGCPNRTCCAVAGGSCYCDSSWSMAVPAFSGVPSMVLKHNKYENQHRNIQFRHRAGAFLPLSTCEEV